MKEKNIQELAKRMGLITVENMCQYTISQLVVMVANKVNELVDEVWRFETDVQEILKTQNKNIQYLLGEGLHLEVGNIFDGWVQDGTFDTLLNQSALKRVNDRIDETNAQLSDVEEYRFKECYGAKYDGSDESDTLQFAIDDIYNRGGGTLYIQDLIYIDKTVKLKSNVHLKCNNGRGKIKTHYGTSGDGLAMLIAENEKNITIDGLTIENNGYGASGDGNDVYGYFSKFGACLNFGNCEDIVITNCKVLKGGGYKGSEGCANIWLSCCRNSRIVNNTVSIGDNLITVDRWYSYYNGTVEGNKDGNQNIYNDGIIIANNNLSYASGRAIAIENIHDKGSFTITGNTIVGVKYAGIDGRDFTNCLISNNAFNGSKSSMINPHVDLGYNDLNWNWSTDTDCVYGLQLLQECKEMIISNNVFKDYSSNVIQLFNFNNSIITGNKVYNSLSGNGIYIKNQTTDIDVGVITDNLISNTNNGIYIRRDSDDTSSLKNLVISNNAINFKTKGIILEYVPYSIIKGNRLSPLSSYGGTIGVQMINCSYSVINDNLIDSLSIGCNISNSNSCNFNGNLLFSCTTAYQLVSGDNHCFSDKFKNCQTVFNLSSPPSSQTNKHRCYNSDFDNCTTVKNAQGVLIRMYSNSSPSNGTWDVGDTIINNSPVLGSYEKWIYSSSTWKPQNQIL